MLNPRFLSSNQLRKNSSWETLQIGAAFVTVFRFAQVCTIPWKLLVLHPLHPLPFVGFSNLAELVQTWHVSRGLGASWNIFDVDKSKVLQMFVSRFCFLSWSLGICSQRPRCVFHDPFAPCLQQKKRSGARWTASVLDAQGVGVSGCTGLTRCAIGPRQCGFVTSGRSWLAKGLILRGEVDDDKVSIHYFNLLVQTAVVSRIINLPFGVIQLSIYGHIWDGL